MPRCFSISIQSEVAWRVALRALTLPAMWIAPANSSSFSVRVVFPASGWEMMAKVRRCSTRSARTSWETSVIGRGAGLRKGRILRAARGSVHRKRPAGATMWQTTAGSTDMPENSRTHIDALRKLNDDYIRSVANADVKRFDEILSADFLNSNPDGSLVDRKQF